ncbi:hypothetical protein CC2G_006208 [Coprinopsis cinerea AmutBmut pab1-1]|nr:hypothetical protein CC2G_006208 [Coprinopsis cinerea AmutBmut pab1-1]
MFGKLSSWWSGSPAPESKPYDPTDPKQNPLNPEGLKPCCACPLTKRARDDCFLKFDAAEAPEKCKEQTRQRLPTHTHSQDGPLMPDFGEPQNTFILDLVFLVMRLRLSCDAMYLSPFPKITPPNMHRPCHAS